jgi:hypothetical protein
LTNGAAFAEFNLALAPESPLCRNPKALLLNLAKLFSAPHRDALLPKPWPVCCCAARGEDVLFLMMLIARRPHLENHR